MLVGFVLCDELVDVQDCRPAELVLMLLFQLVAVQLEDRVAVLNAVEAGEAVMWRVHGRVRQVKNDRQLEKN